MYNIKQAAARAGVSVPVLRAWERRYGIVSPERTASNYRQYDDAAVARIRTMRSMVEAGWSPSAAATAILAGEVPTEPALLQADRAFDRLAATGGDAQAVADRLVGGAAALDAERVDATLDDLFARGSFERVASDLLFPALEQLGDAWARGEVSVAGEHLASAAAHRRLGLALEAAGAPLPGPPVVIGLPPGARHELGALAFAVAVRRAGIPVAYLGADLPIDDWVGATDEAAAAVIGVVTRRDRAGAVHVASRLATERPGLLVAFGGRAAPATDGVVILPPALAGSVAALESALRDRPRERTAASMHHQGRGADRAAG